MEINIYCDESRHLERDKSQSMAFGAITCPKEKVKEASGRMREIRAKYNLKWDFEIKWSKVSPSKSRFYLDIVDLFFDLSYLRFRGVIIPDKKVLNIGHDNQTHDEFIYKMHYEAIKILLSPHNNYFIYIDMKDTQGGKKIKNLHEKLCDDQLDFEKKIIRSIVQVQADEVELVQLCDLMIGALQYSNNNFTTSKAKLDIVKKIQTKSKYSLRQTTLMGEDKFNLLVIDRPAK